MVKILCDSSCDLSKSLIEEYDLTIIPFSVMLGDEVVENVRLRVSMRQAQYFRALPLHDTQREYEAGDGYVDFGYRMCITYDLVQELMSLGREVEVLSPLRLRNEVQEKLRAALAVYEK